MTATRDHLEPVAGTVGAINHRSGTSTDYKPFIVHPMTARNVLYQWRKCGGGAAPPETLKNREFQSEMLEISKGVRIQCERPG